MRVRLWAAAMLLCLSGQARAADWWWVGLNGNAPNRVLTYVDRASIRPMAGGGVEVWLLAVGETVLPNGQQHQANHWAFKCAEHSFSALGRIALTPAWERLPFPDLAATAYAPLDRGSIGESAMNLVCGHPSGSEVHVDQPAPHALAYLHQGPAQAGAPSAAPPVHVAAGAPDGGGRQGEAQPPAQPAPARASEWWWIGTENDSGALAYVDRALIQPTQDGRMEAFLLEIYGAPLASGATREVAVYRIDCRNRHYERSGAMGMDEQGHQLASSEKSPPTGTIPRGTVGYGVYALACGQLTGQETRIDDPFAHAGGYFHRQYATVQNRPAPPDDGQAGTAPAEGGTEAGAPGQEHQAGGIAFGTAFFVGPEGYALTAYHVVDGADRVSCRTGDGAMHEAVPARLSQANDLALLRFDFRPAHYLSLAPRGSLSPGLRVFTIGYGAPNFLGTNEPRFTEGTVSALSGLNAEDSFVQITVPIQPGNSGGPLVNEAGQVVGIIDSSAGTEAFARMEGALPESINWAVKADYAAPMMPPQPPARSLSRAQAIALTHDAICLVVAEHDPQ